MRNEQAGGTAVLRLERFPVVGISNPGLAVGDVLERKIRRVASVAMSDDVACVVLADVLEQGIDGDACPRRVELGPLGHAVNIHGYGFVRQPAELVPGPSSGLIDRSNNSEIPPI
jgi:hypothetical protein